MTLGQEANGDNLGVCVFLCFFFFFFRSSRQ